MIPVGHGKVQKRNYKPLRAILRNQILQGQGRDIVNVGNIISKYELKAYNVLKY